MRRFGFFATAVLFLASAGCGDGLKRVPVQGKITAQGKPLDGAAVQFIPTGATKGEGGLGVSDKDGNFTMSASGRGDKGIVPGEYKVRVSRLVTRDGSPLPYGATEADTPGCRESIPRQYASADGTPFKVTVPDTGAEVKFDIPQKIWGRK